MTPIPAVIRKHERQPYFMLSQTKAGGPSIDDSVVPELNIPVANARSLGGNHSATALIAAGKLPASPKPSMARQNPKPSMDCASTCSPAAADHHKVAAAYPMRVPKRSMKFPAARNPIV